MFEWTIKVLNIELSYQKNMYYGLCEEKNQIECKNNISELQQAISVLEKAAILNDLFKDAIVVGEKAGKK